MKSLFGCCCGSTVNKTVIIPDLNNSPEHNSRLDPKDKEITAINKKNLLQNLESDERLNENDLYQPDKLLNPSISLKKDLIKNPSFAIIQEQVDEENFTNDNEGFNNLSG